MSKLLSIFDVVPGWLYVACIGLLVWAVLHLEAGQHAAQLDAANLRASIATEHAEVATSAASSVQVARDKERGMGENQTKVSDELQKDLGDHADRVDSLRGRMRDQAATFNRAGGEPGAACAGSTSGSDGFRDPGLRSAADADLVVLDGQAQGELAELIVRAREVGKTLKACRVLLRQAWKSTNDQLPADSSTAPQGAFSMKDQP